MKEIFTEGFWNAERRAWLYKVAVAAVPLFVAIGIVTDGMAQLILSVIAALLGVGASGMALTRLTPDNIFTVGLKVEDDEE